MLKKLLAEAMLDNAIAVLAANVNFGGIDGAQVTCVRSKVPAAQPQGFPIADLALSAGELEAVRFAVAARTIDSLLTHSAPMALGQCRIGSWLGRRMLSKQQTRAETCSLRAPGTGDKEQLHPAEAQGQAVGGGLIRDLTHSRTGKLSLANPFLNPT